MAAELGIEVQKHVTDIFVVALFEGTENAGRVDLIEG